MEGSVLLTPAVKATNYSLMVLVKSVKMVQKFHRMGEIVLPLHVKEEQR